ncbi:hypothetical protein BS47DRAFT_1361054 [Hydnum rufescens UP504]|uniref:Aldehyde dehydrogenase domain-containing protein n=1 Tax=Hydnum rufescens UP504 TaxID=1448309 RepID=A0A9P6B0Y4_9AGAM|nr:hypothetical protein BS47DRAFT_1361054 [Hydnum rufescens UP504]
MACGFPFEVGYASMQCWKNLSQFASVEGPRVRSFSGAHRVDSGFPDDAPESHAVTLARQHGERALRPERRRSNLLLSYKTSVVHYEPLGVVAAIMSWNYPLHNALSPVIAAIFAGNAVVLKCSEYVVWSSRFYLGALRECLYACGWDPDIVQLVSCFPEHAEVLTTSPDIKHITFVGSETIGRKVAVAATKHLTPVTLELGGKYPAIILPRTNIKKWSSVWMRGAFQPMAEMSERIRKLRVGSVPATSPEGFISVVDGGSMINDSDTRFDGLEKVIQDAVAMGAHLYDTIDEAVDIANGTRYGPGTSVFGPDQQTCKGVALALNVVWSPSTISVYTTLDLPFGGIKASGCGRSGGREGLRALTYTKAVIVDRFPLITETFQRRWTIQYAVSFRAGTAIRLGRDRGPIYTTICYREFISGLVAFDLRDFTVFSVLNTIFVLISFAFMGSL